MFDDVLLKKSVQGESLVDTISLSNCVNLMDGMHRALAVCEVLSTTDPSHPIENLKVNVVVYQLKEMYHRSAQDYEIIMGSVTRNSACIRDFNHNLTGTSHEAILLMLTQLSFRIKLPFFQYDQKKKKKKQKIHAAEEDEDASVEDKEDPISKFITNVKVQVQKKLQSITNLNLHPSHNLFLFLLRSIYFCCLATSVASLVISLRNKSFSFIISTYILCPLLIDCRPFSTVFSCLAATAFSLVFSWLMKLFLSL